MSDSLHLLVPGPLDQRTGGYLYDARMVSGLRGRGWSVQVHSVAGSAPGSAGASEAAISGVLGGLPDDALVVIDGLALGGPPAQVRSAAGRLRILALVHHPLCDETGLPDGERRRLEETEREALAACGGVITTSRFTADRVHGLFGVPRERLRVAPPGTEPAPEADGPDPEQPPRLLSVGSVIPRKGHDVLLSALARLEGYPWEWVVAGSLTADPGFAGALREAVASSGLEERIELLGEVDEDEVDALLGSASLFVLPSHYEGYGMALTEALARGLPVVSTRGGAIPGTVPAEAGLLVPPGDADALRQALGFLLGPGGAARRRKLAGAARRHGSRLPDWDRAVEVFAGAVRELREREASHV